MTTALTVPLPPLTQGRRASDAPHRVAASPTVAEPALAPPVAIDAHQAVRSVTDLSISVVARLLHGQRHPISAELVYLPWWMCTYQVTVANRHPQQGQIAIESRCQTMAKVPHGTRFLPFPDTARKLPKGDDPDLPKARQAIWFEVLGQERRRSEITVVLESTRIIHIPYWVVYVRGRHIEALPVDATTGKVDLVLQDAMLAALLAARAESGSRILDTTGVIGRTVEPDLPDYCPDHSE